MIQITAGRTRVLLRGQMDAPRAFLAVDALLRCRRCRRPDSSRPPPCPTAVAPRRRAEGLNRFLEYAMTKDNVFLVTVSQVLDWMKSPGERGWMGCWCRA